MDFSHDRKRRPLILELTPLIDVVFLLLIFFMVSTTFVNEPSALEVDLPMSSAPDMIVEGEDIGITMTDDGRVFVDGEGVTMEQLRGELRRIAQQAPTTQVVLRGDKGLEYQRLIDVMTIAHELGLTNFSLATDEN
ncbi:MAG: biopolymer transporter ExbD [Proteobacteria bacterium]|nr:biopolymer transporter ExbD [Pseudomonadota bacterium]